MLSNRCLCRSRWYLSRMLVAGPLLTSLTLPPFLFTFTLSLIFSLLALFTMLRFHHFKSSFICAVEGTASVHFSRRVRRTRIDREGRRRRHKRAMQRQYRSAYIPCCRGGHYLCRLRTCHGHFFLLQVVNKARLSYWKKPPVFLAYIYLTFRAAQCALSRS